MKITYQREEIVSSLQVSKQLGPILNKAKHKGRIVLSRNNHLEAVILPLEKYEGLVGDIDHLRTALEIKDRKTQSRGKRVSWESLRTKHGL